MNLSRTTFNDASLQASFEENGYVIMPLLNQDETSSLRTMYLNNSISNPKGLHSTINSGNAKFTARMYDAIVDSLLTKTQAILQNYKPVLAQYLVKEPKTDFTFELHTDTSMADEVKFNTINIWCALEDVSSDCGALFVWKGGHKHIDFARAAGPPVYIPMALVKEIEKQGDIKIIELKAGEAIIMDIRIAHGSLPNHKAERRIAANLRLIPEEADNLLYFKEPNGDLSVFKVAEDFYKKCYSEDPESRPNESSLIKRIDQAEILAGIQKMNTSVGHFQY